MNADFEESKTEENKPVLDEKLEPNTKLKESDSQVEDNAPLETVGGHYEILKLIAEGGMSSVYLARHNLLDQLVAVKFLLPKLVHDKNSMARFKAEAQAASRLQHPNIASVREFGITEDKRAYIVMEYVEGQTLEDYIRESESLDTTEIIEFIIQLCDGLNYAHSEGVIHRDLKPANLSILESSKKQKQIKILDFGIAKILRDDESGPNLTKTGDIFGTPKYMSPEQCYGSSVDVRSDIYSIGCILFECITGDAPFQSESILDLMMKQVQEEADLSHENLTDTMKFVISKCMAKDPNHRYQSIIELQEDLKLVLNGNSPLNFTQENLDLAKMQLSQTSDTMSDDSANHQLQNFIGRNKVTAGGIIIGLISCFIGYQLFLTPILNRGDTVSAIESSINKSGVIELNEGHYSKAFDLFKTAFDDSSALLKANKFPKEERTIRKLRNHAINRMILASHIKGETEKAEKLMELSKKLYKEHISETDKISSIIELWEDFPRTSKNKIQFEKRAKKMLALSKDLTKDHRFHDAIHLTKLSLEKLNSADETDTDLLNEFKFLYGKSVVGRIKSNHSATVSADELELARKSLTEILKVKNNSQVYYYLAYLDFLQGNRSQAKSSFATARKLESAESEPLSPDIQLVKAALYEFSGQNKTAKSIIEKQISLLEKEQDEFLKKQAQLQLFEVMTKVDSLEDARTYLKDKIERFGRDKQQRILARYYYKIGTTYHRELAKKYKKINSTANPLEFGDKNIANTREFKFTNRFYLKSLSVLQKKEPLNWNSEPTLRQLSLLYLLAKDYKKAEIYMKEWISVLQLWHPNYNVNQEISTLGILNLKQGGTKNKAKATKIYKDQLNILLSTPPQKFVAYNIWFSDLAGTFADSKDKELILKRLKESKSLAKKRFYQDLEAKIATNSSGTIYLNQLNMYAKTLFTFGERQKAFDTMTEAVRVVRTGKVLNAYSSEIFFKYAQLLDLQNKKKEADKIREEMKQYQI